MKEKQNRFLRTCYRMLRQMADWVYPKFHIDGMQMLPEEPCIIVSNHAQIHGPLACELRFPGRRNVWCAGEMMYLREVPAYAYHDFWSRKPKHTRWFYKLLSYIIAPLCVFIFNNAHTIAVYHDARLISTFRKTVNALCDGNNVIIFPEHASKHNRIVNDFQNHFVDVAKLFYKRTGKALSFIPMYICPTLKKLCIGTPTVFSPDAPIEEERRRICDHLMQSITQEAEALPVHTVVPYDNVPKEDYPLSKLIA